MLHTGMVQACMISKLPSKLHCSILRFLNVVEHPDLSMGDMSKKLGELWREASSEEKEKYKVCHVRMHILAMDGAPGMA